MINVTDEFRRQSFISHLILTDTSEDFIEYYRSQDDKNMTVELVINGETVSDNPEIIETFIKSQYERGMEKLARDRKHLDELVLKKAEQLISDRCFDIQDLIDDLKNKAQSLLNGWED